jgi:hypothetical protein
METRLLNVHHHGLSPKRLDFLVVGENCPALRLAAQNRFASGFYLKVTVCALRRAQQLSAVVSRRIQRLQFEPAKSAAATVSSDIVRGSGVQLGTGWACWRRSARRLFRWVENDAQIRITAVQPEDVAVSLIVEPGPGVGGRVFLMKVLDGSGRQVGAAQVERRGAVKLFVQIKAGQPNEFRLHVDGGGKPAPNDPRTGVTSAAAAGTSGCGTAPRSPCYAVAARRSPW